MENNEQFIEVDYDTEKVKEYQDNYIMEEEGIGAYDAQPYDQQSTFNEDSLEDLLDKDDCEVLEVDQEVKEGE